MTQRGQEFSSLGSAALVTHARSNILEPFHPGAAADFHLVCGTGMQEFHRKRALSDIMEFLFGAKRGNFDFCRPGKTREFRSLPFKQHKRSPRSIHPPQSDPSIQPGKVSVLCERAARKCFCENARAPLTDWHVTRATQKTRRLHTNALRRRRIMFM